ncbi:DNRLRE domain-containing protein [Bailinhaonella thermotolerans]|uniref:DNRLRE domain-containing protein n=1 Tax=Bailinhaonella thermotolerans TaxID=1070861 RepID=A0A3A4AAY2_9ACTN|nr:DNRLRE domain-containing protein [Bailinhaonella thermotolerans]RJL23574.1 DNRLRE domain-containing protein [Bailinhaonella thermotolerans]
MLGTWRRRAAAVPLAMLALGAGGLAVPAAAQAAEEAPVTLKPYRTTTYVQNRAGALFDVPGGLTAGMRDPAGTARLTRSYMIYSLSGLRDRKVLGATLRLRQNSAADCVPRPVELGMTQDTVGYSWNTQPTWIRSFGTQSSGAGGGAACPAGDLSFDVTGAVQDVLGKTYGSDYTLPLGIRVPAESETDPKSGKLFGPAPELVLTLDPASAPVPQIPGVPKALRVSSGPYAGFQFCFNKNGSSAGPVTTTAASSTTLGATPDSTGSVSSATFRIRNVAGVEVYSQHGRLQNGQFLSWVSPGQLPAGRYSLQVGSSAGWTPSCELVVTQ